MSGRPGRPRLSDDAVKQRTGAILDTTLDLVAERGADNVRLRDVADAASVSVGTLQHYFYTRDRMVHAAFERQARGVVAWLERYADDAPRERIMSLLEGVTSDPDFGRRAALWIEFAGAAIRDDRLRVLMEEAYASWRSMLERAVDEGIASGQFKPIVSTEVIVASLLALIDGHELAHAITVPGATASRIGDQIRQVASALLGTDR